MMLMYLFSVPKGFEAGQIWLPSVVFARTHFEMV